MDNINIRQASAEDTEAIARIKVDGWQTAYDGLVDSEYLNAMDVSEQSERIKKSYALENIFIAERNAEILGFCRVCNYDNAVYDDKNIDCEIREIYVRYDMKRMGIGSKLFSYVLSYFKQNNKRKLYLSCFKENYNSRKFYEKMGGTLCNEQEIEVADRYYKLVSYTYDLQI